MNDAEVIALIERGLRDMIRRRPGLVLPPLRLETELAELGIDSIEFIEAVANVEDELGTMLPSESLTACRTIGELVRLIQADRERARAEHGPDHSDRAEAS